MGSSSDAGETPIRVSGLKTAFGENVIHEDLDLEVRRGEILGVVGGSGSGKSVLLNTILGLKRPDGGTVEIFGRNIDDADAQADIERRIGVMFQQGALFSFLTVQENVETPLLEHTHLSRDFVRDLARLKIVLAGLPDNAGILKPAELSGGMRKRAGVARAIALDPEILFLDEPTSGLDPIAAGEFDDLVNKLREALGLTVFMISISYFTCTTSRGSKKPSSWNFGSPTFSGAGLSMPSAAKTLAFDWLCLPVKAKSQEPLEQKAVFDLELGGLVR